MQIECTEPCGFSRSVHCQRVRLANEKGSMDSARERRWPFPQWRLARGPNSLSIIQYSEFPHPEYRSLNGSLSALFRRKSNLVGNVAWKQQVASHGGSTVNS